MPTKTLPVKKLEPFNMRTSWKSQFSVICKSNLDFVKKYAKGNHTDHLYCYLYHVFETEDNKTILQFKNHQHVIEKTNDFHVKTKLQIEEDWLQHRGYPKNDDCTFYLTWEEFQMYFTKVYVNLYSDNLDYNFKKFSLSGVHNNAKDKIAVNIQIKQKSLPIYIEIDQLDKLFADSSYKYSDIRMYVIKRDYNKKTSTTTSTLIQAKMSSKTRANILEVELPKGSYTIIGDFSENPKFQTDYVMSVYYPQNVSFEMEEENVLVTKRAYLDMICRTVIENYKCKDYLGDDEKVRRYTFRSEKLSLFVILFTNNTHEKYTVMEKLDTQGEYECNINIEKGYMKLTLPPMSKKAVIFKFKKLQHEQVTIQEHTMFASKKFD